MAERNKARADKAFKKPHGLKQLSVSRAPYFQFNVKGKGAPRPEYKELMGGYMMANFGETGLFWKTDQALVVNEVSVANLVEEYPGMSDILLLKLFEKRIEKKDGRIEIFKDNVLKIFGIIMLTITE